MALQYNNQNILHYRNMSRVDEDAVNAMIEPLVIIKNDEENQHIQIKVTPFNYNNSDKNLLSFIEKAQYFKQKIRRSILGETSVSNEDIAPNTNITLVHLINYYDLSDGIVDEYNEFLNGLNNGGDTGGFDNNISGLFGTYFLDMSPDSLTELTDAINGN